MNFVKYQIEATAENAELIQAIAALMTGGTVTAPQVQVPADKPEPKATKTTKTKVVEESPADPGITHADLRGLLKEARAEHGEDFCKAVLSANGAAENSLGRMLSALTEDTYADVAAQLQAGPTETAADEPEDELDDEDDGLDDDTEEDTSEVTAEAVKLAVKAYAKEVGRNEAKELMNSNGAASLSKIDDCTPKQLQAMFKAATA